MNGNAKSKYIRMSPRKIGLVLDKIRGKKVAEAYTILNFINRRAVSPVRKTLQSAVANADARDSLDRVRVVKAWVGQGPVLKRLRPRAMGRADILRKPTAHIEIEVG
ncbi:MAG: 50S ribosomal protein L22 [Elusimicrobiota bacterium]